MSESGDAVVAVCSRHCSVAVPSIDRSTAIIRASASTLCTAATACRYFLAPTGIVAPADEEAPS